MKLKNLVCLFALAGAGLMSLGSTYTGGQCAETNLLHRWSFNGDLKDSVNGVPATSLGRYFWNNALTPTQLKLQGGSRGTSGISLGSGVFPTSGSFTIEMWTAVNEAKSWSRILDVNFDSNNYFCMAWSNGTDLSSDRVEFKLTTATTADKTMGTYALNTFYHISATFTPRSDGKIAIAWARRNVSTGAIEKSSSLVTSVVCPIAQLSTWTTYLGRSPFSGDNDACATYDEVRVWKGALSAEQLNWSAKLGPDVLPTTEPATHTTTVTVNASDAALGTVAAEDGTPAASITPTTAYDNNLALTATPATGALFRRWTGATDAIVSGSATTPAISVRTQKPITLTAEFVTETEPVTATWTGAGTAGDFTDPANWTCKNLAGTVLANTIPTTKTAITVTGTTAFTCPAGSSLPCESITFSACTFTADCDLRGLTVTPIFSGTSQLAGHKLYTATGFAGSGTLNTPFAVDTTVTQPTILSSACFWLDASDESTITKDASGNVTKWTSKDSSNIVATASSSKPVYSTTLFPGRPTIDFGAVGSGKDMTYTRFTKLRTVFWVIKIVNSGCSAFLLGDANGGKGVYNFHRGNGAQFGHTSYAKFSTVWDRTEATAWGSDAPSANRFHILCATMSQDCYSDSLTQDRAITTRNGGRQLSELICFNTVLSEADRLAVTDYLVKKWYPESAVAEVHVEAAAGTTLKNTGVAYTGPVRFFKDGAGTYNPTGANGNYEGGTRITAGTMKAWTTTYASEVDHALTIDAGATLDIDGLATTSGRNGAWAMRHTLNGGSVFCGSGSDLTAGWTMLGNQQLTADSTIRANNNFGFISSGYRALDVALNNHTLDIALANGKIFYLYNAAFTNGTVRVPTTTGVLNINQTSLRAPTADFDLDCRVSMNVAGTVRNLTWRGNNTATEGTAVFTVSGTFAPLGDAFPNVTLASGATLDLSTKTKPWSLTSTCSRTCSFASGATITVDIHGRTPAVGERLITWTSQPTATFQWDATTAALEDVAAPTARADGLYYGPVENSTVAQTATWTGAADDGDLANAANWSCTNAAGEVVADGVPNADTAITVPANLLPQIPSSTPLACRSFTVTGGSLAGDLDLRGLSVNPTFSGTVDVGGHILRVPGLAGTGTITSTVDEGTELITNGSFESYTGTPANSTWGYFSSSFVATGWSGTSGLAQKNTTWIANNNLPDGTWALFIQSFDRSIYQTVTAPADGFYHLAFSYAVRPSSSPIRLNVQVDDTTVGFVNCNNTGWLRDHMVLSLTAGSHKIAFKTEIGTVSGDKSALLDLVSLKQINSVGELHVDVPSDTSCVNSGVAVTGNLKLVKEGAGLLQQSKSQSYICGTEVNAGTLRSGLNGVSAPFGVPGSTVTVASGAACDTYGYGDFYRYYFVLDGGRLVNWGTDLGNGTAQIGHLRLTADSRVYHQDFIGTGHCRVDIDLNGHTLTYDDAGSSSDFIHNATLLNGGTLKFPNVVNLYFYQYGIRNTGTATSIDCAGAVHLDHYDVPVKDYTQRFISNWNSGAYKMIVAGTFKPFSSYYPNVQLNSGATLDLSALTAPFVTPSIDQRSGSFALTFAANAAVKIETGDRVLTKGDKLISWTAIPSGITFALTDACAANYPETLVTQVDGLYYGYEPTEVVDATWTGAAGTGDITTPGNWTCLNAAGTTVADGLPTSKAAVHIKGSCAPQIPAGSSLPYATLDLDHVQLTADCDWRGFPGAFNGYLDLNGHKLYVSHLTGSGYLYGTYASRDTGWITTTERLIWRGLKLADVKSFSGTMNGAWIGNNRAANGYVIATGTSTRTVQFQTVDTYTKMTQVLFTEKSDGVWAKAEGAGYVSGNYLGKDIRSGCGSYAGVSVATSASSGAYGVFGVTATVTAGQSELHLDTDESVGSSVAIGGNLKLVKEGTGTYVPTRTSQTYAGGTEIAEGDIIPGQIGTQYALGTANSGITIDPGAAFDLCGSYHYTVYKFQLNGGTLKNSRDKTGDCQFGQTVLLADSTFQPSCSSQFWEGHTLDLGGHTLTVPLGVAKYFILGGGTYGTTTTIKNGTLDITSGGWLQTTTNTTVQAGTTTLRVRCALDFTRNVYVKDYESFYGSNYNAGTNAIYVSGTFTPHTAYYHGLEMQNGSTLDLTNISLPWSTKSSFTAGTNGCAFAANATVQVKLGATALPSKGKVIDWTGRTPASLDTLTFKAAPTSAKGGHFIKKTDGLYLQTGMIVFIR